MTSFEAIRSATPRAPFFHLVYIGADADRAARLLAAVEEKTEVRQFFQATSWDEAAALLGRQDLRVGLFDGCLIVVCDLDDLAGREIRDWLAGLPEWPSGQLALFLVTEESPELTLREFLDFVDRDFAGLGDFGACLGSLGRWCSSEGLPDLGLPFPKRPSFWLRNLKHDYFSNAVLIHREKFEELGLLATQREIDFIGNVLRNLLCLADTRIAVRALPADSEEKESDLYRRIYSTPVRIVAPASFTNLLAAEYTEGSDFVLYQTMEAAAELLDAAAREGCARVLLQAPEAKLPQIRPVRAGSGELPIVLVDETAPLLEWHEWQARLAANVVGSYAISDLEGRRSGKPILVAQRPYWRACAFLSLPALFDHLIELLAQTYEAVDQKAPQLREQVLRSLAAIGSARAVYLG